MLINSDLHQLRSDWGESYYPIVPGHEIAGIVTAVGDDVGNFSVGDKVGVGCMVNSCLDCALCKDGKQQYCQNDCVWTYNSVDMFGDMDITYGGYSTHIVVREEFVVTIPDEIELPHAAPLLCAGITLYSPINKFCNSGEIMTVGIVGFGGLGHMGVKILKELGHKIVVISSSEKKKERAMAAGAESYFVVNSSTDLPSEAVGMCDVVLDTVSVNRDMSKYFKAVRNEGTYCILGLPPNPLEVEPFDLVAKRLNLTGSLIGGMEETEEMLNFCAHHNIRPDIEIISSDQVTQFNQSINW